MDYNMGFIGYLRLGITIGIADFEQTLVRSHTHQLISINGRVGGRSGRKKFFFTHFGRHFRFHCLDEPLIQ